eukprot:4579437-Amphidinium_carterae.1
MVCVSCLQCGTFENQQKAESFFGVSRFNAMTGTMQKAENKQKMTENQMKHETKTKSSIHVAAWYILDHEFGSTCGSQRLL